MPSRTWGQVWINTDKPLHLAELGRKVVLVDMWICSWINDKNVIPSLRRWYQEYHDQGLVITANHFPEFSHDKIWIICNSL